MRPAIVFRAYAIVLIGMLPVSFLLCSDLSAAEWSAVTEAKTIFTDNVFELSASRRLAFSEDPSQPVRVSVGQPSDVVWEPSIDVRRTTTSSLGTTQISFKADGFLYTNNPAFNHGDYRFQVQQQVATNTSVQFRYRYVPNLFLGPNIERHSGNQLIQEERVTEHVWRMQVEQKLNDRWTAMLLGRYGLRLYNEVFSERDTKFYSVGPSVRFQTFPWMALTLDYIYERGLADGRNEPQFRDDVSYHQHFMSFGTLFTITEQVSLEFNYVYRLKLFTSAIVGDPFNGTVDQLHQGTAQILYKLSPAIQLALGFQRTQRSSDLDSRNFFNTNVSLGLQYRF